MCLYIYTNYQKLLADGDVESNPRPTFKVQKLTFGIYNQGDVSKFGVTAGTQCASNSLVAICWSCIKRVGVWKSWDLDNILVHGDNLHKWIGKIRSVELNELPAEVKICDRPFQAIKLKNDYGLFPHYWDTIDVLATSMSECEDIGHGVLVLVNGYTSAVIWAKSSYYLFDSHGHDSEGIMAENGTSILLMFQTTKELQKYIKKVYLNVGATRTQYEFQYIKVEKNKSDAVEIAANIVKSRHYEMRCLKRKNMDAKHQEDLNEKKKQRWKEEYGTPKQDLEKEKKRKHCKDNYSKINGTEKHEVEKENMREYSKTQQTPDKKQNKREENACSSKRSTPAQRVEKFQQSIIQGTYYICVHLFFFVSNLTFDLVLELLKKCLKIDRKVA